MNQFAIFIPSYNRVGMCWRAIRQIRSYSQDVPIFITVEKHQYKEYRKVVGKYAYIIPLPKNMLGAGYSIYFGFNFLSKMGFRYVLRIDDDVKIKFHPKVMYKAIKNKKEYGWIAGWVGIYDLFYKGKEKYITDEKIGLYDSTTYCPSMCYGIDLFKLREIGGWDWRMRHLEDVCATFRFHVKGYKRGVLKSAPFTLMARTLEVGKGGISSTAVNKVEAEKKNIEMLQNKYGSNVIVKKIHENGKTDFNLRKLFNGDYEWNKKFIQIPDNFVDGVKFDQMYYAYIKNAELKPFPKSDKSDDKFVNDKLRYLGLWKNGITSKLDFNTRMKMLKGIK